MTFINGSAERNIVSEVEKVITLLQQLNVYNYFEHLNKREL